MENAVDDSKLTLEWGGGTVSRFPPARLSTAQEQRYIETVLATKNFKPDPTWYNQKPLWQRAAVIFAGPVMSLFLGYFLFCAMGMTAGLPYDERATTLVESVVKGKPAERAKMLPGDRIVRINDTTVSDGKAMIDIIHNNLGKPLQIQVERNNALQTLTATPEAGQVEVEENGKTAVKTVGLLGFAPHQQLLWRRYSPTGAIQRGTVMIVNYIHSTLVVLTHPKMAAGNVGGVLRIAGQIHQDSKEGPWRVTFHRRPAQYQPGNHEPASHSCTGRRTSAAAQYRRHPPPQTDRTRSVRRAACGHFHHRRPVRPRHV